MIAILRYAAVITLASQVFFSPAQALPSGASAPVPGTTLATPAISIDAQVRLLGGYLPLGADATSAAVLQITQSSDWRNASASASMSAVMRSSPGFFSAGSIAQMQAFFSKDAPAAYNESRNVLYLFGGADVLYPSVLFPNMNRLLLVGLEEPGQLWSPQDLMAQGTLAQQMGQISTAYKDLLQISFFITEHMSTDLQRFGTATMIAVGLVARGNHIVSVRQVSLDARGQLVLGANGRVSGVQVQYTKPSGENADVIYLKMYLNDVNLRAQPEFSKFVQATGFNTAYYKAASYVPHDSSVVNLNRLVLSLVQHVVQNDDGIPFAALRETAPQWNLKLFGIYSQPSVLFGAHTDQDLLTAYDQALCASATSVDRSIWNRQWPDACHRPSGDFGFASLTWGGTLPFRYGYTWQTAASPIKSKFSNLLILDRR